MVWAVERAGARSYLVGTAHFFPYRFRESLRRYISRVEAVLCEGPLDEESAGSVIEHGSRGTPGASLVDALDRETIGRITRELGRSSPVSGSHQILHSLIGSDPDRLDWNRIGTMKPWMAFFQIWSHYLRQNGWTCNMELDALRLAGALGKPVHFLETIEEQLEALDDVPFERFVHFLTHVDWRRSRREHLECYLRGDLEGLMARVSGYPTVCDAIIGKRDPVLFERMRGFLEKGPTLALVGASHCPGIGRMLGEAGYAVRTLTGVSP
jgi:uncharacterized protein YbaP (TraB family)